MVSSAMSPLGGRRGGRGSRVSLRGASRRISEAFLRISSEERPKVGVRAEPLVTG